MKMVWKTPDSRVEYIDTPEGFAKVDAFWFLLRSLSKYGLATEVTAEQMKNIMQALR